MAVDFYIKQSDTAPPIVAILKDALLVPVNLTATTVRFIMTNKATGDQVVDAPAVLVDAANGKVQYEWATGDTDVVGPYSGEFEVTWPDTTYETFPNKNYINIKIVRDLGGTVG